MVEAYRCDNCLDFSEGERPGVLTVDFSDSRGEQIREEFDHFSEGDRTSTLDLCHRCLVELLTALREEDQDQTDSVVDDLRNEFTGHPTDTGIEFQEIVDEASNTWEGEVSEKRKRIASESLSILQDGWEGYSYELINQIAERTGVEDISFDSSWEQTFRPVLKIAEERGMVTHGGNNIWRWTGE